MPFTFISKVKFISAFLFPFSVNLNEMIINIYIKNPPPKMHLILNNVHSILDMTRLTRHLHMCAFSSSLRFLSFNYANYKGTLPYMRPG